ncbi:hypothetical protein FVEG_16738 [Fusarium verticillioides 7600]|uniref:Trichothecene 3-O-acetyltransferase-like N-terminal domain-containing protein n=1 Tax=Gibberella moniliformis (strain M3125 / FGSC 7600) TaxID=334819 RepID=W7MTL3_GIBM7|nr:hypothetical protein FVEG_16738 [Fusarium verticillioides 7600]EWG51074.1 hypothetical protein FVEG_16738 [Fusarium verticillioides 7600]
METAMLQQLLNTSWIEPAGPVSPGIIELSAMDSLTAPVYPSPTLFFPLKPGANPLDLYNDCKRGLARYLYQHPHLCGKIVKDETGRNSIEISPAPYAGAHLVYYDHREMKEMPSYDEFKRFGFPFADGNRDGLSKLCPENFPTVRTGDPVIITRFNVIRGGIVLTVSIAHAICDLVQFIDCIKSWATHTQDVSNARMRNEPEPSLPEQVAPHLVDRSPMKANSQIEHDLDRVAARAANLPYWTMLDPRKPESIGSTLENLFTSARLTDSDLASSNEAKLRQPSASVWKFPKSSIRILDFMAKKGSSGKTKLSAIDCLTAFTWQRFFEAKWAPDQTSPELVPETTRIVYVGSVRPRLTPPLPLNYLPTCVDLFPVTATTKGFYACSPRSVAKVATQIRISNDNWSEKAFREMLEVAQMHPFSPGIVPNGPLDALTTDHTRLGTAVAEDWGALGRCEAYREPYIGRTPPLGEITFLPRWHSGEISVMFAGEAIVMERLRDDETMNAAASCQFIMHDFPRTAKKVKRPSRL